MDLTLVVPAALMALMGSAIAIGIFKWQRTRKKYAQWARSLCATFSLVNKGAGTWHILAGEVRRRPIEIHLESEGRGWIQVEIKNAFPVGLHLMRSGVYMGTRFLSGDRSFDAIVHASAIEEADLTAMLTQEVRRITSKLLRNEMSQIIDARFEFVPKEIKHVNELEGMIQEFVRCVEIGEYDFGHLLERLKENALKDDDPAVRLNNIKTLWAKFTQTPEAMDVFRAAMKDGDDSVALTSAGYLGREGLGVICSRCPKAAAHVALNTLKNIKPLCETEEIGPVLVECLQSPFEDVRLFCETLLGEIRFGPSAPHLVSLWDRASAKEQAVLAEAVGRVGDVTLEEVLIGWLSPDFSRVRTAVANALGMLGGKNAVAPLRNLIHGVINTNEERAAQSAIAQIQSRLGPAERGTLAVAETQSEEGAISLQEQGGEISETKETNL